MRAHPLASCLLALAALTAGCDRIFELREVPTYQPPPDAPPDAMKCYGTGLLTLCREPPTGDLTLAGPLNAGVDSRCEVVPQAGTRDLCVIAAGSITIQDGLAVLGGRPLVLLADTTIHIESVLDAASVRGGKTGPGAPQLCGTDGNGSDGSSSGSAGGAGGTFGFRGGNGADGAGGASDGFGSPLVTPLFDVRAGCPGFRGGAVNSGSRAQGGDGGGAVYLVAGEAIDVTATGSINASGAGGQHGDIASGGGGGGAGGLIVLDAPSVTVAGELFARGGGGGGGGGTAPGMNGLEATSATSGAGGGAGGTSGGGAGAPGCGGPNGTDGGFPTTNPATFGGGGGGGACGYIRIYGNRAITGTLSPAPTP